MCHLTIGSTTGSLFKIEWSGARAVASLGAVETLVASANVEDNASVAYSEFFLCALAECNNLTSRLVTTND